MAIKEINKGTIIGNEQVTYFITFSALPNVEPETLEKLNAIGIEKEKQKLNPRRILLVS